MGKDVDSPCLPEEGDKISQEEEGGKWWRRSRGKIDIFEISRDGKSIKTTVFALLHIFLSSILLTGAFLTVLQQAKKNNVISIFPKIKELLVNWIHPMHWGTYFSLRMILFLLKTGFSIFTFSLKESILNLREHMNSCQNTDRFFPTSFSKKKRCGSLWTPDVVVTLLRSRDVTSGSSSGLGGRTCCVTENIRCTYRYCTLGWKKLHIAERYVFGFSSEAKL